MIGDVFGATPRDLSIWAVGGLVVAAVLVAVMIAGFRPANVSWRVRVWYQAAFALAMIRVFTVLVNPNPPSWWSSALWVHLLVATAVLLVAIVRATERGEEAATVARESAASKQAAETGRTDAAFDRGVQQQRSYGRGLDDEAAYQDGRRTGRAAEGGEDARDGDGGTGHPNGDHPRRG